MDGYPKSGELKVDKNYTTKEEVLARVAKLYETQHKEMPERIKSLSRTELFSVEQWLTSAIKIYGKEEE